MQNLLTSLHHLSAFPLSLHHRKGWAIESLRSNRFFEGLANQFCARVRVFQISHSGGTPILNHSVMEMGKERWLADDRYNR